jgi:ABC-2 type transport system permease protein/sodium transport system permease protein
MKEPDAPRWRAFDLGRLLRLARKELNESLRDRRTIFTLILMPLLLYPLLAVAFTQIMAGSKAETATRQYWLGFASEAEARSFSRHLLNGLDVMWHRSLPPGTRLRPDSPQPPQHAPLPILQFRVVKDLREAVQKGRVDLAFRFDPPGRFERPLAERGEVFFRKGDAVGMAALRYVEFLCAEANVYEVSGQQRSSPVSLLPVAQPDLVPPKSTLLPALVPLILILMTITGAVYPAIDLTAGERERGTLEVLVAAPIPRLSVLFAKYVAVLTVAVLTALVNLGTMTATLYAVQMDRAVFQGGLSPLVFIQVLGLLLLFASFFSAVLLTITSFARSFKEAQAYLIPLMLAALMPGMLALFPDLKLGPALAVVPLINVVLLARDVFAGSVSPALAALVTATTLLYAVGALAVAARIFGTEAVLSEQSAWSDFWRRPAQAQDAATPSAALLCLAVMFPAYFLMVGGLSRLELSPAGRLVVMALANVPLFLGFPLASAWLGRVRLRPAFRLRRAGWLGTAAALLLGLSLWPFISELVLALREFGFTSLSPEHLKRSQEVTQQLRRLPPESVVLALAVIPAVLEELFFRGYLFSALLKGRMRPGVVVFATAALFALFHLFLPGAVAVERLPVAFLLGLVLGWVAWRTGSVVPGILLHAAHNATLVLLSYYEPQIAERQWIVSADDHLPAWLLLAAGATAVVAALGVWAARRSEPEA